MKYLSSCCRQCGETVLLCTVNVLHPLDQGSHRVSQKSTRTRAVVLSIPAYTCSQISQLVTLAHGSRVLVVVVVVFIVAGCKR